ncbi:MAG TPA: hypothetical protein VMI31_16015 [Fimbriimonadaceae bacterium]|nr:hypothetical protein [Fimbriimonadaceae bacterium]
MGSRAALLFAFLFAVACLGFGQEVSSPEAVVRSFLAAVTKGDYVAASKLVKGGKVGEFLTEPGAADRLPKISIDHLVTATAGNRAIVTFDISATMQGSAGAGSDYMVLERTDQGWLIDPPMLDGGLSFMAYLLSDPPMFEEAHKAAEATSCLSNVKQVALGIIMLEADCDDVLKVTADNWVDKVKPYLQNRAVFTCPLDPKGTISYSLNAKLIGKSDAAIQYPATTVLVYEGKGGKLDFRHNGRAAVAFVDGHAKLVGREEAKSLRWTP